MNGRDRSRSGSVPLALLAFVPILLLVGTTNRSVAETRQVREIRKAKEPAPTLAAGRSSRAEGTGAGSALPAMLGGVPRESRGGDDSERPKPGEGILLPPSAIEMAEGGRPGSPDWDPMLPVNMAPRREREAEPPPRVGIERQSDGVAATGESAPFTDLLVAGPPNLEPASCLGADSVPSKTLYPYGGISFRSYPNGTADNGPPDPHLTVGRNYAIAGYNSYYEVYDKATGALASRFNMATLFAGLANCGNTSGFLCDPQVLYDDSNGGSCPAPTDQRYLLSALWIDRAGSDSRLCVAVSKGGLSPVAAANFWTYEIDPAGSGIADYPHIAAGPDALLIGYNWIGSGYAAATAISKAALYTHTTPTAREYTFAPASTFVTPEPAVRVGCAQLQLPTYNGTHIVTTNAGSGALQLWRWPTPATSNDPVAYGSAIQASNGPCTRPSGSYYTDKPIDCFPDQRYLDAEQRGDFLYAVRGTQSTTAAIQWAKINVGGASPSLNAGGVIGESGNELFMPSITADMDQDLAIVYSRASQSNALFVGASIVGREGTSFGAPLVIHAGEKRLTAGVADPGNAYFRWGDYSAAAIDPDDGCFFWANGQYAADSAGIQDGTWIATFKFASCCPVVCGTCGPSVHLDKSRYRRHETVTATATDSDGRPTNGMFHSTSGGAVPATLAGSGPTYTASIDTDQLGAADGDQIWFTARSFSSYPVSSGNSVYDASLSVCFSGIESSGTCDADPYLDRGELVNVAITMTNGELYDTPTGFAADLVVDPAYPDPNIAVVTGTGSWDPIPAGSSATSRLPFQVRYNGLGTGPITCHFKVQNVRATDTSWSGSNSCSGSSFVLYANADDSLGSSFAGFPESFDGTTFPPTGWSQVDVTGTALNWARSTNTSHPTGGLTHSGAGLAFANDYDDVNLGDEVRLQRSVGADCSAVTLAAVQFWMFHDTGYSGSADTLRLQLSTDGSGATWAAAGPAWQRTNTYGKGDKSWSQHTVDVSSLVAGKSAVRIGFLAHSEYGNDLHLDDVNFAPKSRVDGSGLICDASPALSYTDGNWKFDDGQCSSSSGWAEWAHSMDAGEGGNLLVYLANDGGENADNVQGILTCPTCPSGVTICKGTASYGTIPYGTGQLFAPADDGFRIALGTGLAAGTDLPFHLALTASGYSPPAVDTVTSPRSPRNTRVGTAAVQGSCTSPCTGDQVVWYDQFAATPTTGGFTGRCGPDWSTTPWSVTGSATSSGAGGTGCDAASCRLACSSTTGSSIARRFDTTGANVDVTLKAYVNLIAGNSCNFYIEYTPDIGATTPTWYTLVAWQGNGGTGDMWASFEESLYWNIHNRTGSGFGPAAANAILDNPNFGLRFRGARLSGTGTTYFYLDEVEIGMSKLVNQATACPGVCRPPDTPSIQLVVDEHPCAQDGIRIFYDGALGASGYILTKDGSPAATGYISGALYNPGDSSSHGYSIRAENAHGFTDSSSRTFADSEQAVTPTITCVPATCTGAVVTFATESGMSSYQWYLEGSPILGANSSTCTAAASGRYSVSYAAGACPTNRSLETQLVICCSPPIYPVPGTATVETDVSGANLAVQWDATTCPSSGYHVLYGRGENLPTLATSSPLVEGSRCALGTSGSYVWSGPPDPSAYTSGFLWFVVVADGAASEGSWGRSSNGQEEGLGAPSLQCGCTSKITSGICLVP